MSFTGPEPDLRQDDGRSTLEAQATPRPARRLVSIVVPCRNEVKSIRPFLDSLLKQDLEGIELEVIVADGRSDDGTRPLLETYCLEHPQIRVIDNHGLIVSTGLNAAIRASRGDIIIRMDAHSEYRADYVRRSVELLEQTGADNVGGPTIAHGTSYIGRGIAAAFQSNFSVGARGHQANYEGPVDTVFLGCWRREVFERIGLFDEKLVRNQDDELNLRLLRAGGRIWQSPEIVSRYQTRTSLWKLFRQYFQYGFWKVAVIRKHRIPASWRHLVPGSFVLMNCLLFGAVLFKALAASGGLAWPLAAWVGMDGIYAALSVVAAWKTARKAGWDLLPLLPVVFAIYHTAWGFGFLLGIVHFSRKREPGSFPADSMFTEITH